MTDSRAKNAIYSAKRKYEVRFDATINTHKRNLLFAAVLSVFAILVTPKNGQYEINLGVISGAIEYPIVIYIGLMLITLYQVYYFWLICRQTIINSVNMNKIEEVFMYELASSKAFDYWNSLCRKVTPKGWNSAIGNFMESPNKPRENNNWKVRATTQVSHLEEQPELLKNIQKDENFSLKEERGFYQLDFIYQSQPEDYIYLQQHRDHFWLTKKKEFVEYVLPLIVGYGAILGLTVKIGYLLNS